MWNKFFKKKPKQVDINSLLTRLNEIRTKSDVVALHPSPTEGNWLGIANATKSLYPKASLEIPQWYSNQLLSDEQINLVCETISKLGFKKVVLSGFPYYFFVFAEKLHTHCQIQTLFHGTVSEFHSDEVKTYISKNIDYINAGIIHEFACIKPGLHEIFQRLYGFKTLHCPLPNPEIPADIIKLDLDKGKKHIGVFGPDTFNKNLHNQVLNALLIEDSIVHVLDASAFEYLHLNERIVGHGTLLPRKDFLSLLASMDLNLYMSYSESWGLVAYESEALGVKSLRMDDVDYLQKIKTALL